MVISLLCILFATDAFAGSYDYKIANSEGVDIYYRLVDGADRTLSVVSGDASYKGNVVIPGTVSINGYPYLVVAVGDYAFYGCSQLTYVSIPLHIQTIGMCAFSNCDKLTSIHFPKSVKKSGIWHSEVARD